MNINETISKEIQGKRILFISTKEPSYIRNVQEIELLSQGTNQLKVVAFENNSYFIRILRVYLGIIKTLFERRYDIIFIGFAPQLLFPFLAILKHKASNLWIDFFISMYDTLVFDRKKIRQQSPASKILKWLDKYTLKKADLIITDTNAHKSYFCSELEAEPAKCSTLYLTADKSIFHPQEGTRPAALEGKYLVHYFGSILPLQGVEVILQAARLLADNPDIYFEIIGPLPPEQTADYNNVSFYSWLSTQELASHIAYADLCLAGHFSPDIDKARRTIAGKTYIYKAMNKPVVLGDNEANRELHQPGHPNYYVPMGDAEELAKQILFCAERKIGRHGNE